MSTASAVALDLRVRRARAFECARDLADRAARYGRPMSIYEENDFRQLVEIVERLDGKIRQAWIAHRADRYGPREITTDGWARANDHSYSRLPGSGDARALDGVLSALRRR